MSQQRKMSRPKRLAMMFRSDFVAFVPFAYEILFPGRSLQKNWHIDLMAQELADCLAGKNTRLILNAPPQSLKSFIASIAFPAFALGQDSRLKIMSVVANRELASELCEQLARLLASDGYRQLFPHISAIRRRESLALSQGGIFSSTPFFTSPVGRGADILILDDPTTLSEVQSEGFNEKAARWYADELASRLNEKSASIAILVMQRLHFHDLSSSIFTAYPHRRLAIAAVSGVEERRLLPNGTIFIRPARQVLCPQRETLGNLYRTFCDIGGKAFTARYLQQPWQTEWVGGGPMYYDFDTTNWTPEMGPPRSRFLFSRSEYLRYECFGVGEKPPYLSVSPLTDKQMEAWVMYSQAKLMRETQEDLD